MFNLIFRVEKWRYNEEYDVFVSSEGRLRDKNKKQIFPKIAHNYLFYYCNKDNTSKRIPVHRLVLMTFKPIDNYKEMTVDHLNHNTRDNTLKNLEWVEAKENQRRASRDRARDVEQDFSRNKNIESCINVKSDELYVVNGVVLDKESTIEMILGCQGVPFNREKIENKLSEITKRQQKNKKNTYGFIIEPYKEVAEQFLKVKINGFVFDFPDAVNFIFHHNGFCGSKEKLETHLLNFLKNSKNDKAIMYTFHIEKV